MIEILWEIFVSFLICTLIYGVFVVFNVIHKINTLENKYFKNIEDKYDKEFNSIMNTHDNTMSLYNADDDNDDSTYDKTDEELLEDWNNLWGGNPPCELNIKAIRDEERREKENKGE